MSPPPKQRSNATRVGSNGHPAAEARPPKGSDPTGRHVFFTGGPASGSHDGRLQLECARCHTVSPVSPFQLLRSTAPLFVWVPLMKYSRWARCPACSKHSWVKLHVRL